MRTSEGTPPQRGGAIPPGLPWVKSKPMAPIIANRARAASSADRAASGRSGVLPAALPGTKAPAARDPEESLQFRRPAQCRRRGGRDHIAPSTHRMDRRSARWPECCLIADQRNDAFQRRQEACPVVLRTKVRHNCSERMHALVWRSTNSGGRQVRWCSAASIRSPAPLLPSFRVSRSAASINPQCRALLPADDGSRLEWTSPRRASHRRRPP